MRDTPPTPEQPDTPRVPDNLSRSELEDEVEELRRKLEEQNGELSREVERLDNLMTVLLDWKNEGSQTDGVGHFSVAGDTKKAEKGKRLNKILRYLAEMAANTQKGKYQASKLEIYKEVFDGDDGPVSLRTVGRYCQDELPEAPAVTWDWPGNRNRADSRIDTNNGKRLKFDIEAYQEQKND